MNKEIIELIKRLENKISNTQTGELRNLLCDANITIRALSTHNVINCLDLEPDFINALNQLVNVHRKQMIKSREMFYNGKLYEYTGVRNR